MFTHGHWPGHKGLGKIKTSRQAYNSIRIGSAKQAKAHPVAPLVIATLPSGEGLILATDKFRWSTRRLLEAYKKRWHIERFNRFVKDAIGLAHLYSFHQSGIQFLLYTVLLLAMLLMLGAQASVGETVRILRRAPREIRACFGLGTAWKRNMFAVKRAKKKQENH